ncbi:MAG: polysaccharide deacetylase family protein [Candidatus Limnocylindrales bacterium]
MSSARRRIKTRVAVAGALLVSAYLGALGAFAPISFGSGPPDGSAAGAGSSLAVSGGAATGSTVALARFVAAAASGEGGNLSPTTPDAPPPGQDAGPTPRPTAAGSREPSGTPAQGKVVLRPRDPNRVYRVPILMYHRVVPPSEAGKSAPGLVVPPATFSAQLKAFSGAGWHSITMATLAHDMETDTTIPPKTFVITFDDGWADGFDYAFPIMREYGYVGTFFVISSRIDCRQFLSTQQLRALEAAGNEIGNHTEHHVSLASISTSRFVSEVETASEEITRAVGHRPVSLAYPMGGVSTHVATLVSQIPNIEIAVTTGWGKTETWFERYDTPRVRVQPTTDPTQLLKLLSP